MRQDLILDYCAGKKPKEIIEQGKASRKTAYYYHKLYKDMKQIAQSEEFANQIIRLIVQLRIKGSGNTTEEVEKDE